MDIPSCSHHSDQELRPFELAQHCCESFDKDGEPQNEFAYFLFMVGEWLMDNKELMAQFVSLYQENFDSFGERVCFAIGFWIRSFPMHFDADPQLCRFVERLKQMAISDKLPDNITSELDVSSVPSYEWLRNVSVRNPVSRHVSLSFEQWSPEDISTSLSYIDYKVLSRVNITEIKKYVKSCKISSSLLLERSIAIFNSISGWVQCMILSKNTPKERAEVMTKFLNVGKHLRKLNNFNTMMAVIGGVTHSNIARLSKTHNCLSNEAKRELTTFTHLMSNTHNFENYRKLLQDTHSKFRIPIMGVHLKDLIIWYNTQPRFDSTGTITERRLIQLRNLLNNFLGANRMAHNFPEPNLDLINTLKVSFDIRYNDGDIYDLSLLKEPRTLLNFQSARSVVFADWASGVCPAPDPETVNKHISAMVEAVFKHYDNDKDAYISEDEFAQIAGNFPFIDSFAKIDEDKDGRISKSELKTYFLYLNKQSLNKQSLEFRRGFQHNFHETTFLTPTFCIHCNKVLWGLIRQGYKCKDCGITAHHACKDVLVSECRRRRHTSWLTPRNSQSNGVQGSPNNHGQDRHFRSIRTVSTVSEEHSNAVPTKPFVATGLRASFHRLIRLQRKPRAASETTDCYRRNGSASNPSDTDLTLATLASEEVFDDDPDNEPKAPATVR
ncbi:unnamed protein product [Bursaphelenchus okinawaensis]|uniref:Ras guanyl-releasing protein 3 n=1 Tax=Bursaphelenchus okinawaensis TaxID=465554 RepID=A0A811LAQ9_9BILA|nr:unnamed protein product [Bursaphelenchus okinawaensis]CAG9120667.1 unnamed protein product [Bursaphelenchus okinawaensis]